MKTNINRFPFEIEMLENIVTRRKTVERTVINDMELKVRRPSDLKNTSTYGTQKVFKQFNIEFKVDNTENSTCIDKHNEEMLVVVFKQ